MQLSAPTTSSDSPLAAFAVATGRPCAPGATTVGDEIAGLPAAFAQILTGATPVTAAPTTAASPAGMWPANSAASVIPSEDFASTSFPTAPLGIAIESPRTAPTLASAEIGVQLESKQDAPIAAYGYSPVPISSSSARMLFPAQKFGPSASKFPDASKGAVGLWAGSASPSSVPTVTTSAPAASSAPIEAPIKDSADNLPPFQEVAPRAALVCTPNSAPAGGEGMMVRPSVAGIASPDSKGQSALIAPTPIASLPPSKGGPSAATVVATKSSAARSTGKKSSLIDSAPVSAMPAASLSATVPPSPVAEKPIAAGAEQESETEQPIAPAPRRAVTVPAGNSSFAVMSAVALPASVTPEAVPMQQSSEHEPALTKLPVAVASSPEPKSGAILGAVLPTISPFDPAMADARDVMPDRSPAFEPSAPSSRPESMTVRTPAPTAVLPVAAATNPTAAAAIVETIAAEAPATVALPAGGVGENLPASSADDSSRLVQFGNAIPSHAEIFAALDQNFAVEKKFMPTASDKTFLSAAAKRVAIHSPDLGIGVAKSAAAMSTSTFSDRAPTVAPLERAVAAPVPEFSASPAGMMASEPSVVGQRAVDAVMTAVERFSAGDRHAVQLQFSVGGADLAVRVELRGEEVRTTFRTDSPELRSALAHEWQASTPDNADRSVRIAAPVFASNESANFTAFSGDTASRQRDARGRRAEADDLFSAVAARARGANPVTAATETATPVARTATATARHFSTLA